MSKIWEYKRVFNILCMRSLDEPIESDGETATLKDTIGSDNDAKFLRLKTFLLTICKNKNEECIVELLSRQYSLEEISEETGWHTGSINRIIRRIKKRCLKLRSK